jgi:hypothetical protein
MKRYDPLTYRHPRTLEEAFGPYEGRYICEEDDGFPPMRTRDAIALYISALALAYIIFTALAGMFQ